jgi:hypothetical protein
MKCGNESSFARCHVVTRGSLFGSNDYMKFVECMLIQNFVSFIHLIFCYKGKGHPITGHQEPRGGVEVQLYSFPISSLEGDGWSAPRLGRFTPGKTRYPLYWRLDGPQCRSERVRKISPRLGFDPRNVQSVVSRYTDWATQPTIFSYRISISQYSDHQLIALTNS